MVSQGSIIKINLNPNEGHEQAGYRPAIVVSNNFFNSHCNMTLVCPITNTNNSYPLHIPLDNRTQTTGVILCEHIRSLDIQARGYRFVEQAPNDIIQTVINTILAEMEQVE
ncbi:type II toxin-antitoxin system PemK/MazF family toxin [Ruminococcus sp.]|uniref:type II toxin-antitoxin system PemK/MazF family toxin n=1 Tax=Ruminococcus sp. TaxID=41978 RepID=UPI00260E9B8E|nr:type II toxin-antitoxin system PemK/MazF family toxin [Ruminococcus sp.]MDD6988379.1 type II toxin-antitoxin system PemK/MazF family toxin [Ruminococcus sp.]MDY6202541.1 type II toxin-antitoxin system PemK/MazF family toxin [Ruminococcus sp.]